MPATGQALPRRHLALSAVQGALLGRDRAQHREDPEVRREMRRPDRTRGRSSGVCTRVFPAPQLPAGRLSEEGRAGGPGPAGSGGAPEAQGVSGRGAEARLSALGNPSEAFGSALRN